MNLLVTQSGSTINLALFHEVVTITRAHPHVNYLKRESEAAVIAICNLDSGCVVKVIFEGKLAECEAVKADFDAYLGANHLPSMFPPAQWAEGQGPPAFEYRSEDLGEPVF